MILDVVGCCWFEMVPKGQTMAKPGITVMNCDGPLGLTLVAGITSQRAANHSQPLYMIFTASSSGGFGSSFMLPSFLTSYPPFVSTGPRLEASPWSPHSQSWCPCQWDQSCQLFFSTVGPGPVGVQACCTWLAAGNEIPIGPPAAKSRVRAQLPGVFSVFAGESNKGLGCSLRSTMEVF